MRLDEYCEMAGRGVYWQEALAGKMLISRDAVMAYPEQQRVLPLP